MTLGEKIRYARKCCGLSQEQMAQKLCVSRSAIAKWETDKGLPDVENLKTLSRLLGISVDSLLDDSGEAGTIRQSYQLSQLGKGCKKVKKHRLMRQKFPDAAITALLGRPEPAAQEGTVDSTRGFLTTLPFGSAEFMKSQKELDRAFYLVETEAGQLFVTVTDEFFEVCPLDPPITETTFRLGYWIFIRCNHLGSL